MRVTGLVCMSVVIPVVPDPPQRTVLRGERTAQGEDELEAAACPERPMGKQPVIAQRNAEGLDCSGSEQDRRGDPARAHHEYQRAGEMNRYEGKDKR